MVMGRRTWESIGRPLPGRQSIVLTKRPGYQAGGASIARNLDEALQIVDKGNDVFVIGGATLYKIVLERVERIYLTYVDAEVNGDTFFPDFDLTKWNLVHDEPHPPDAKNPWPFRFQIFHRV